MTTRGGARAARTHIALLRGVNIGASKRVPMADLRALALELGWSDPRTLLASGNLVYASRGETATAAAARLEEGIRERIGVSCRVVVLTAPELSRILDENPLAATTSNPSRLLAAVWTGAADRARVVPLAARDWGAERLALGTRAAYLWCPEGISRSELPVEVGRALGDRVTKRNWTTMTKLRALADA